MWRYSCLASKGQAVYIAFNSSFSIIPPRHLTTIQVKIKRSLSEGGDNMIWNLVQKSMELDAKVNGTWYKNQWSGVSEMELAAKTNGAVCEGQWSWLRRPMEQGTKANGSGYEGQRSWLQYRLITTGRYSGIKRQIPEYHTESNAIPSGRYYSICQQIKELSLDETNGICRHVYFMKRCCKKDANRWFKGGTAKKITSLHQ